MNYPSETSLSAVFGILWEIESDIKHKFYAELNTQKLVQDLGLRICTSDEKLKIKIYHDWVIPLWIFFLKHSYSINGQYHNTKDYLLMSRIPDFARSQDLIILTR